MVRAVRVTRLENQGARNQDEDEKKEMKKAATVVRARCFEEHTILPRYAQRNFDYTREKA